jgi:hypothetical protein
MYTDIQRWPALFLVDRTGRLQPVAQGSAHFGEVEAIKVSLLFGNPEIRRLLAAQPSISLEVKDDEGWFGDTFPEGVDELYFQVAGVLKDVERLKLLYELFAETLNHLCHIGAAYEDDPKLALS